MQHSMTKLRDIEKNDDRFWIQHKESRQMMHVAPQRYYCFELLLKGHSIKEIGRNLNLSPRTVEFYLKGLRRTVGCKNGKELVAKFSTVLK